MTSKINKKIIIRPLHLIVATLIFAAIIFLAFKVVQKFLLNKKNQLNQTGNSLPFKRLTLLKKTPLYATPNLYDRLEQTVPRGTELLIDKIVNKKWTFMRTKINGITRWVIGQFLQHVPVKVKENENLPIGRENVNINNPLPFNYKPGDLVRIPAKYISPYDTRKHFLRREALNIISKLIDKAKQEGIKIYIVSAFRSAKYQLYLFQRSIRKNKNPNQRGTAKPTYSEHQLGTTVDFTCAEAGYSLTEDFEHTRAFRWIKKNMKNFGLKLSYPRNNREGYIYEPWHFRYVKRQN